MIAALFFLIADPAIDLAYQREATLLASERAALTQALAQTHERHAARLKALTAELGQGEANAAIASAQLEANSAALKDAERDSLRKRAPEPGADNLENLIAELQAQVQPTARPGVFFGLEGDEHSGTILTIGPLHWGFSLPTDTNPAAGSLVFTADGWQIVEATRAATPAALLAARVVPAALGAPAVPRGDDAWLPRLWSALAALATALAAAGGLTAAWLTQRHLAYRRGTGAVLRALARPAELVELHAAVLGAGTAAGVFAFRVLDDTGRAASDDVRHVAADDAVHVEQRAAEAFGRAPGVLIAAALMVAAIAGTGALRDALHTLSADANTTLRLFLWSTGEALLPFLRTAAVALTSGIVAVVAAALQRGRSGDVDAIALQALRAVERSGAARAEASR